MSPKQIEQVLWLHVSHMAKLEKRKKAGSRFFLKSTLS